MNNGHRRSRSCLLLAAGFLLLAVVPSAAGRNIERKGIASAGSLHRPPAVRPRPPRPRPPRPRPPTSHERHERHEAIRDEYHERHERYERHEAIREERREHWEREERKENVKDLAGFAIGAVIIGSVIANLECDKREVVVDGELFFGCGDEWYQQVYRHGDLVYVRVPPPPGY